MIGHMILKRGTREAAGSSAAILGLKIAGGRLLDNGHRGAIIEKVKRGSIADVEGQLKPGSYANTVVGSVFFVKAAGGLNSP